MTVTSNPHEEPGMSPMEFVRLQEELQKRSAELAEVNAALRESEMRLEERVEERTRQLYTLLRVSQNITTTLELESLLGLILDHLREVVEYRLASIAILEDEENLLLLAARGEGMPEPGTRFPLSQHVRTREMLEKQEPAFVPDLNVDTPLAQRMRENLKAQNLTGLGSWMSAPLVFRGSSIGTLNLAHSQNGYYHSSRVELAMAFANQAAAAIANARLYEQTRQLASLEERQRLARELHDSVSQALYGIVLGARTARTILDREPSKAAEPLDYLLSLAEAGLAEMRALIFELRPESLQTEGLVAALGKLVHALSARHSLVVWLDAAEEPEVSLDIKEALFRIAQEALNNIAKHARAQQVDVRLAMQDGQITIAVLDDGTGFDTSAAFPGHLGLQTMRERAERAGGSFAVVSTPGSGTCIKVTIPFEAR